MLQPGPAIWDEPGARAILANRDIAGLFRLLRDHGYSQRVLAGLVIMSQSEVSEVLKGRQVQSYDVLVRVCEGLGIPHGYMGLAYDEDVMEVTAEEVDEEMQRRALLAAGTIALFNAPILGQVLHIPVRPHTPTPLPSRLVASDVTAMRSLTESLRTVARTYGGGAEVMTGVARRSLDLMTVPASDHIHAGMASTLANLHTMAGWTCVDSGFHDQARACFGKAMELAKEGHDTREMASAFRHAGIQMGEAGAYNDALKSFQLGLIGSEDAESVAWLNIETAWPYAFMGHRDLALDAVKKAREYPLTHPFDLADMDYISSYVYWQLGKVDTAEGLAVSSVHKWRAEGVSKRDSVEADLLLATVHARAGEPDTALLSRKAIAEVADLRSVRVRQIKLRPLVLALEARPHTPGFRDLAVQARSVMQTVKQA